MYLSQYETCTTIYISFNDNYFCYKFHKCEPGKLVEEKADTFLLDPKHLLSNELSEAAMLGPIRNPINDLDSGCQVYSMKYR